MNPAQAAFDGSFAITLAICMVAVFAILARLIPRRKAYARMAVDFVRRAPWRLADVVTVLAVPPVAYLACAVAGRWLPSGGGAEAAFMRGAVIFGSAMAAGVAAVMWRRRVAGPAAMGLRTGTAVRDLLTGVLAAAAIMPPVIAAALAVELVMPRQETPLDDLQPVMQTLLVSLGSGSGSALLMLFLAVLAIPAVEEFYFRGILFPAIAKKIGIVGATAVVSVLFSAMHFHVRSALPLFVLSAGLCMSFVFTRSLAVPVAVHCLFNFAQIMRGLMCMQEV